MKNFSIKIFTLVLLLLITICIPGLAKIISNSDGRVYYTTPDTWHLSKSSSTASKTDLLSVARDDTTGVTFNRIVSRFEVRSFRDFSYAQKCGIRDDMIRMFCNSFKAQGYDVTVARADVYDAGIYIVYYLFKYGQKYYTIQTFSVKNHYAYIYGLSATDNTWLEATTVFKSLAVDGVLYSSWIEDQ